MKTPYGLNRGVLEKLFAKVVAIHPNSGIATFGEGYAAHASAGSYRFVLYETAAGFAEARHEHDGIPPAVRHRNGEVVARVHDLPLMLALRWFVRDFLPKHAGGVRFHKLVWACPPFPRA